MEMEMTKSIHLAKVNPIDSSSFPPAADPDCGDFLSGRIQDMVKNDLGLYTVSSELGVRPSTLRKILEGKSVSPILERKIDAALRNGAAEDPVRIRRSSPERLLQTFLLYQRERSLHAVGKRMGLCRERVRQLLVKGSQIGLFRYESLRRPQPFVSREKILADYKRVTKLNRVAGMNGITAARLKKLVAHYGITQKDLDDIRREHRRLRCIEEYHRFAARLGHLPTTTELQRSSGAYLSHKITTLWGSFGSFRKELQCPDESASPRRPSRKGVPGQLLRRSPFHQRSCKKKKR
jgi:hypothetical protein